MEEKESAEEKLPDLSSKSILIAEDEYSIYYILAAMLEPSGIKISWARNGREALAAFEKENYDAVVLDIKMPLMDGIETLQAIRMLDKRVPVIVQTAYTMNEEIEFLEKLGFNGYISKPFVKNEVIKTINKLIKKVNIL